MNLNEILYLCISDSQEFIGVGLDVHGTPSHILYRLLNPISWGELNLIDIKKFLSIPSQI